ncbi:two pore domain potassium channel family protein [Candidatus Saccharibacteria bacterium]|nr:two pore domain potassium channel family protein [Candidatus Saccharibacteria bacterium]
MDTQQLPPPRLRYILLLGGSVLGIGVVFYHFIEKLSWLDSLYFCVVTLATVGYGDITPKTPLGKLFTTFYILIGIGIFAAVVNYLLRRRAMQSMAKLSKRRNKNDDR